MRDRLHFVIMSLDGKDFGGTFNLYKNDRLYGRYWGCTRDVRFLHFELCYYQAIDAAIDAAAIEPRVTWGINPGQSVGVSERIPSAGAAGSTGAVAEALEFMGLEAGQPIRGQSIDVAFIGSCTNSRIEDLRAAAEVAKGRQVAGHVQALVVPGSGLIKEQAEAEGLDRIFIEAGFQWREAGCSMCLAMNADKLKPGERSASTSNRNFEGRQGKGGRTHLMSPAMAAAAAITSASARRPLTS